MEVFTNKAPRRAEILLILEGLRSPSAINPLVELDWDSPPVHQRSTGNRSKEADRLAGASSGIAPIPQDPQRTAF